MILSLVKDGQTLVPLHQYDGKQVVVKEWSESKTNSQLGYFNGVVVEHIRQHTGDDKNYMKYWLKQMFGPKVSVNIDGKWIDVIKSQADYTKKEMVEFIDRCILHAAEFHGVTVPPPPYKGSQYSELCPCGKEVTGEYGICSSENCL